MVCDPNDNSLNPPFLGPPPVIPGLGIPFSAPKIPFPDVEIPEGIPEDLIKLINDLFALLPGGKLEPNPDNFMKDVMDAIASLLNQIAPYLALYNFFQALLNMILCIIDVLCALMSPFKLRAAVKRLFKRCLPDFLNLFPWLALLAMILALLLLLLALIEYIIQLIRKYIEDIIKNLEILAEGVQFNDTQSTIDAALKIAYLLCLIEQLFAILIAFQAIFAIIQALADLAGRSVCARGDSVCCTEDVCPDFIHDNPDGEIPGTQGVLYYLKERTDATVGITVRPETWQFYDSETGRTYNFDDIITPVDDLVFWPQPDVYPNTLSVRKAPYLIDMRLVVDPNEFDIPTDSGGTRPFRIKDIIVEREPYRGVIKYDSSLDSSIGTEGTLRLVGGKVFEDDGTTPYLINGTQATLETFIHYDSQTTPITGDDGYWGSNIEYTWQINHDALIDKRIITVMCAPDVEAESIVVNNTTDFDSVIDKLASVGGTLPDIGGTVDCLVNALAEYRQDVSIEKSVAFQLAATACLGDLREQAENTYTAGVTVGTNVYETVADLDPDLQFTSLPIVVSVDLKDANGISIATSAPENTQSDIAALISGTPTLGSLTSFSFDGYSLFTADLTSQLTGTGTLTLSFNNQLLAEIVGRDDDDVNTSIEIVELPYEFVGVPLSAVGVEDKKARRGPEDVVKDGEGS
jgi:hypothetical protein